MTRSRPIVTAQIDGTSTVKANGREAQALLALIDAGSSGITSLDMAKEGWAIRLAAYVRNLRKMGVPIATQREAHEGGYHGLYKLAGEVVILDRDDAQKTQAAQ